MPILVFIQEYKVKMYLRMRWHDPRLIFGESLQRDVVNIDASLYNQVRRDKLESDALLWMKYSDLKETVSITTNSLYRLKT